MCARRVMVTNGNKNESPAVTPYLTAASRNRLKALALLLDIIRKILLGVKVAILTLGLWFIIMLRKPLAIG